MSNIEVEPWISKVAKSIVQNVVQFYIDYNDTNCTKDVAIEIAKAFHRQQGRNEKSRC